MTKEKEDEVFNACIAFIQEGRASQDSYLQMKKDILNKWAAGYALSDAQFSIITKMFNMEVNQTPIRDLFAKKESPSSAPRYTETKDVPLASKPEVDACNEAMIDAYDPDEIPF